MKVFSRNRTPTSDDDDALIRVVQYKSIVVIDAREAYLFRFFSAFFPKELPFWGKCPIQKALQKRITHSNTLREFYSEKSSPNNTFADEEDDNNNDEAFQHEFFFLGRRR